MGVLQEWPVLSNPGYGPTMADVERYCRLPDVGVPVTLVKLNRRGWPSPFEEPEVVESRAVMVRAMCAGLCCIGCAQVAVWSRVSNGRAHVEAGLLDTALSVADWRHREWGLVWFDGAWRRGDWVKAVSRGSDLPSIGYTGRFSARPLLD